jgi:hypothetical protein
MEDTRQIYLFLPTIKYALYMNERYMTYLIISPHN